MKDFKLEHYREKGHPSNYGATGNNGFFTIPHYRINDYEIRCMVSDGRVWSPIKNYEGVYEISTYGEVKALKKDVKMPNGAVRKQDEFLLIPEQTNDYPRVTLSRDGNSEKHLVHILVASHFIVNTQKYPVVNHIDGDKSNPRVDNLEWCSVEYNMHHAIENNLKSGLKADDILTIKRMLEGGASVLSIAEEFNKSRQTISDIKAGRHRNLSPDSPTRYPIALWEHVSVTVSHKSKSASRCPTWEEMCWVKDQFWEDEEVVVQYHPAKSEYVSMHPHCLHLWRPTDQKLPTPNPLMVGINLNI